MADEIRPDLSDPRGGHRELTDAERERNRRMQARRRAVWKRNGRCVECGRVRKWPTLRCEYCLIGNVIRVDRAQYKKRMAKSELHLVNLRAD